MSDVDFPKPQRGRRSGRSVTREAIAAAALAQFAERGYGATSVREIARSVGVDPSLVIHYFGSKDGLFAGSLELIAPFQSRLIATWQGDRATVPLRLTAEYFRAWEDPVTAPSLRAIARAASESPTAGDLLRQSLEARALESLGSPASPEMARMQAALGLLFGCAISRYIIRVHPLADLTEEELVAFLEPGLRAILETRATPES